MYFNYSDIKYDLTHNYNVFSTFNVDLESFYERASLLSDLVIPLEYGIEPAHKLDIAGTIARPLLEEIAKGINHIVNGSIIKSRFYFTSESSVHTLLHALLHSGLPGVKRYKAGVELSYLTQIVFNVYKYEDAPVNESYKIIISFSNGTGYSPFDENSIETREQHLLGMKKPGTLNTGFPLSDLEVLLGGSNPDFNKN